MEPPREKGDGKANGRRSRSAWLAVLLPAALLVAGCKPSSPEAGIDPNDARQVKAGEVIYRQHCAACHGANLEGQLAWQRRGADGRMPAPPHDATGHTWHHRNDLLFGITRDGMVAPWAPEGYVSNMPGFGGVLSGEDIRAVLAYIQSTWPPEIVAMRRQMLEQMERR